MQDLSALPPRPLVQVPAEDLAAHELRLAALRKKAGHALWDGPVLEAVAES